MATTQNGPLLGVFARRGQAEAAIDELRHEGFREDQVGLLTPGGRVAEARTANTRREDEATRGTEIGTLTGTAVGAVGGALAAALIPGVGPVLAGGYAAGILAGVIGGAAAGATVGCWVGPFVALGVPEDQAHRYEQELRDGRTILVIRPEDRLAEAERILHDHGARAEVCRA